MSCKDFFPSEDAETFSPPEQTQTFLRHPQFLPRFLPQAPVETAGVDFFPEMRSRNLHFVGSGCAFPPAPLCSASKMVGKLSFRRAEERLWCYVVAVPVVVL